MKTFLIIAIGLFTWQSGLYSLKVPKADGGEINFASFQGKKLLLVNIATGSTFANQIGELEQLYQMHKDSLVIVGFPSNSFQNEPNSDDDIVSICTQRYNTTFPIAVKGDVTGENLQAMYRWLTRQSENGTINSSVNGDFKKYLINKEGRITGMFIGMVNPLDHKIQDALRY